MKGISFIWDESGKIIEQSWEDLYTKICDVRDGDVRGRYRGLGIIAGDLIELLQYDTFRRYGMHERRMVWAELSAGATQEKDIKLLAEILAFMTALDEVQPEACWFVYFLRIGEGLAEFDAKRAALMLNELYKINNRSAKFVMFSLVPYVLDREKPEETAVCNLMRETGLLKEELLSYKG